MNERRREAPVWLGALVVVVLFAMLCTILTVATMKFGARHELSETEAVEAEEPWHGTISVSGTATVEVEPDIASFSVSAEFTEATTSEAMEKASAMVNAAVDVLLANGVDNSGIETGYISVSPVDRWNSETETYVRVGQKACQTIEVVTHDIASVGAIYQQLSELDGISVSTVTLDKEDKSEEMATSRKMAMEAAIAKAQDYAETCGVKVGRPVTISTESSSVTPLYRNATLLMTASADVMAAESGTPTVYHGGSINVTNSVSVTFELVE